MTDEDEDEEEKRDGRAVPEPDWSDIAEADDPGDGIPETGESPEVPSDDEGDGPDPGVPDPEDDASGSGPTPTGAGPDGSGDREGPLGDLASEIDRRRDEDRSLPADELFDERDVDGVDREALWRQVAGEDAVGTVEAGSASASAGPETPSVEGSAEEQRVGPGPGEPRTRTERVIEKRKYCQNCQYFSAPPEVRCTHEGTDIVEAVDMEHFRVLDCPVVAEDEELENV